MAADHPPDPHDHFEVRMHYYGLFDRSSGKLEYTGEQEAELYIPRDNLSYVELCAYAEDMYQVERGHFRGNFTYNLYWLVPGKSFNDGLLFLHVIFNYNRARLAQFTVEGAKDMMNTAPEHWCRAYMKLGSNCDSVDNNMCESFNNWILEARYLPCISMLEWIRQKDMVRIQQNRTKAEKWKGTICPNVLKKLKQNIKRSGNCDVLWNGKEGFEVLEHETFKFTVNLEEWTCSCRYWQLSGLPCCHAIGAIYKTGRKIDDFIAKCYSIEVYNKIYSHCLESLEGEESWPRSDHVKPAPPGDISLPGRPKTERRREEGEAPKGNKMRKIGGTITCSSCQRKGHNMKSCPNNGAGKHQGNSHIVRDATRKRKEDKDAMEIENAKKANAAVEAANARENSQPSSQPSWQRKTHVGASGQGKSKAGASRHEKSQTRASSQGVTRWSKHAGQVTGWRK